jgi:hypothetical protein
MTRTRRITPAIALAAIALLLATAVLVAALAGVVDPVMAGITLNAID